jgi:hypothetical protein
MIVLKLAEILRVAKALDKYQLLCSKLNNPLSIAEQTQFCRGYTVCDRGQQPAQCELQSTAGGIGKSVPARIQQKN